MLLFVSGEASDELLVEACLSKESEGTDFRGANSSGGG